MVGNDTHALSWKPRAWVGTMSNIIEGGHVHHLPTMTSPRGLKNIRAFYTKHSIPQLLPDTKNTLLLRTVGETQSVDEVLSHYEARRNRRPIKCSSANPDRSVALGSYDFVRQSSPSGNVPKFSHPLAVTTSMSSTRTPPSPG